MNLGKLSFWPPEFLSGLPKISKCPQLFGLQDPKTLKCPQKHHFGSYVPKWLFFSKKN
jgi:hypothetical protein